MILLQWFCPREDGCRDSGHTLGVRSRGQEACRVSWCNKKNYDFKFILRFWPQARDSCLSRPHVRMHFFYRNKVELAAFKKSPIVIWEKLVQFGRLRSWPKNSLHSQTDVSEIQQFPLLDDSVSGNTAVWYVSSIPVTVDNTAIGHQSSLWRHSHGAMRRSIALD